MTETGRTMPTVSIIAPVYKAEAYLRSCIDSVLAQTRGDFELILVDDGSPDSCGAIIDEYAAADRRIIGIHQENGGPSAARNAGLMRASGQFVYFLDSDDLMDPALLETVIPRMEEGYDMVVFGYAIIPPAEKNQRLECLIREETEIVLQTDEERCAFITGPFRLRAVRWEVWNRFFRRDIIERWQIRFGEDRRVFAEDMYFTYFYTAHTQRILLLPDRLYTYRRHEGSGSTEYEKHLMIYSSNLMTEAFYEHCRVSADCSYLYDHFLPLYYLLHKGALRRLRRHQWRSGMNMAEARELLRNNIVNYPVFSQRMIEMYSNPIVRDSYRHDPGPLLQLTDRLYAGELFGIPGPPWQTMLRKPLLRILQTAFRMRGKQAPVR